MNLASSSEPDEAGPLSCVARIASGALAPRVPTGSRLAALVEMCCQQNEHDRPSMQAVEKLTDTLSWAARGGGSIKVTADALSGSSRSKKA
jgi:hypothetical protein